MINAYAATEPGGELKPFQYDPGPLLQMLLKQQSNLSQMYRAVGVRIDDDVHAIFDGATTTVDHRAAFSRFFNRFECAKYAISPPNNILQEQHLHVPGTGGMVNDILSDLPATVRTAIVNRVKVPAHGRAPGYPIKLLHLPTQ